MCVSYHNTKVTSVSDKMSELSIYWFRKLIQKQLYSTLILVQYDLLLLYFCVRGIRTTHLTDVEVN